MNESCVARFQGRVTCTRGAGAPVFTLSGTAQGGEALMLTLGLPAPADLPPLLESPQLDRTGEGGLVLWAVGQQWRLPAAAVHLHHPLPELYRVIVPRQPPLKRRLFWWGLLVLAGGPVGSYLVSRARRRRASAQALGV